MNLSPGEHGMNPDNSSEYFPDFQGTSWSLQAFQAFRVYTSTLSRNPLETLKAPVSLRLRSLSRIGKSGGTTRVCFLDFPGYFSTV